MKSKLIVVTLTLMLIIDCESTSNNENSNNDSDTNSFIISGTWTGIAYNMIDIPEHPNATITLVFSQSGDSLSGLFYSGGISDTITDGFIEDSLITFKTNFSIIDNIFYQFGGTIVEDSIGGDWNVMNLTTGEPYTTERWYVKKTDVSR